MVRTVSKEELIEELKQFSADLGKTPTARELNKYGPHYAKLYKNEFGSWNNALKAAGLEPNLVHNISRQELLEDINRVANALDKTPTLTEMDSFGNYSKITYQHKLGSYVSALEELGLEPSLAQYNFSNNQKPSHMKGTKNVRKLKSEGPTPVKELPINSVSSSDKQYGLTKFTVKNGMRKQAEPIYYLFNEHDPEDVIRRFLETNPLVLENRSRKAIIEEIGGFGRGWSDAARAVLDELDA